MNDSTAHSGVPSSNYHMNRTAQVSGVKSKGSGFDHGDSTRANSLAPHQSQAKQSRF